MPTAIHHQFEVSGRSLQSAGTAILSSAHDDRTDVVGFATNVTAKTGQAIHQLAHDPSLISEVYMLARVLLERCIVISHACVCTDEVFQAYVSDADIHEFQAARELKNLKNRAPHVVVTRGARSILNDRELVRRKKAASLRTSTKGSAQSRLRAMVDDVSRVCGDVYRKSFDVAMVDIWRRSNDMMHANLRGFRTLLNVDYGTPAQGVDQIFHSMEFASIRVMSMLIPMIQMLSSAALYRGYPVEEHHQSIDASRIAAFESLQIYLGNSGAAHN